MAISTETAHKLPSITLLFTPSLVSQLVNHESHCRVGSRIGCHNMIIPWDLWIRTIGMSVHDRLYLKLNRIKEHDRNSNSLSKNGEDAWLRNKRAGRIQCNMTSSLPTCPKAVGNCSVLKLLYFPFCFIIALYSKRQQNTTHYESESSKMGTYRWAWGPDAHHCHKRRQILFSLQKCSVCPKTVKFFVILPRVRLQLFFWWIVESVLLGTYLGCLAKPSKTFEHRRGNLEKSILMKSGKPSRLSPIGEKLPSCQPELLCLYCFSVRWIWLNIEITNSFPSIGWAQQSARGRDWSGTRREVCPGKLLDCE